MTDLNRSSTLSLRRTAGSALTGERAGNSTTVAARKVTQDAPASAERALRSDTLLQGRSHVSIMHNGETYQLRATRLGKLILTK